MKQHEFTFVLSGVSELTPELANVLYDATQGDIEFGFRDGVPFVEFRRTADTLQEAIASAIHDVEGADSRLRVLRVESGATCKE